MASKKNYQTTLLSYSFITVCYLLFFLNPTMSYAEKESTSNTAILNQDTPSLNKPFLGIGFSEYHQENIHGIKVDYIIPNSAADKSNLKPNDIIYKINFQTIPSKNASLFFKNYIQNNLKINTIYPLQVIRHLLLVEKKVNNTYFKVDFTLNDIINDIKALDQQTPLSFIIEKETTNVDISVQLKTNPLIQQTSPNIKQNYFQEMAYIAPYYNRFFTDIFTNESIKQSFETLKKGQYQNEFWSNNLKLSLTESLHANPEKLPSFTRVLNQKTSYLTPFKLQHLHLKFLDIPIKKTQVTYPTSTDVNDHITFITSQISKANSALTSAFKQLSENEKKMLKTYAQQLITDLNQSFILDNNSTLSKDNLSNFYKLAKKVDFPELISGYKHLLALSELDWLDNLNNACNNISGYNHSSGKIKGKIIFSKKTDLGLLVIGSKQNNTYLEDIPFLIDLGGNDIYKNNSGGTRNENSTSFLIDFEGDDIYTSYDSFSQGSALLGYSLLADIKGNDTYKATAYAQGSSLFGVATLIDFSGNDQYIGKNMVQGTSLFGIGSLYDLQGHDRYDSELFSQAVGLTKGIGSLIDNTGNDNYRLISNEKSSYGTKGITKGAGQGFGIGVRNFSSGGIGLLIDNLGHDYFSAGNFSQGSGYFFGVGIMINKKGNDTYIGSRYSMGTAAHSAVGIIADFSGNDTYKTLQGSSMGIAWDNSNAFMLDQSGNDQYDCLNKSFCLGQTDHNSFAFFNDKKGKDIYNTSFEKKPANNSYNGGKSIGIFLDEFGQEDFYFNANLNNNINISNESYLFFDLTDSLIFLDTIL